MTIHTEEQAREILEKVVALSTADECTATLNGSIDGNIRFALNNVSTSGVVSNTDLAVQVAFGKRVGTATVNEFDDAALERVVRRAEDLARLAPENPEFMPAIGKQNYRPSPTFSESTAAITPEFRAQVAADSILPCREADLVAAGVIDPAMVTRSALQNAASIAALFLTTEAVVADKPEPAGAAGAGMDPEAMGMM